jgi:hypothetical protein
MSLETEIKKVARSRVSKVDKIRVDSFGHSDIWPLYRTDAWEYFSELPEVRNIIKKYFADHQGEEINHLDISGNASLYKEATPIFAYYSFERKKKEDKDPNIIEGDIMEDQDFEKLINKIIKENNFLDIVTFEPVGGLGEYSPKELSSEENIYTAETDVVDVAQSEIEFRLLKKLIRRLQSVLLVMKTGGLLYLGSSYLLTDYFKYEKSFFVNLFSKLGFKIRFGLEKNSEVFLLEKI